MSKVIVRGGSPGKIRLELEGSDASVDIDTSLNAYQALHEAQPFMQMLAEMVPFDADAAPEKKVKK